MLLLIHHVPWVRLCCLNASLQTCIVSDFHSWQVQHAPVLGAHRGDFVSCRSSWRFCYFPQVSFDESFILETIHFFILPATGWEPWKKGDLFLFRGIVVLLAFLLSLFRAGTLEVFAILFVYILIFLSLLHVLQCVHFGQVNLTLVSLQYTGIWCSLEPAPGWKIKLRSDFNVKQILC